MTTTRELAARPCIARKTGLSGYKIDKCRCLACTTANCEYHRNRDKKIGYGAWEPLVDADPVRAHLRTLMDAGIGWQTAAIMAGVPTGTVSHILYGKESGGGLYRPPSKRCRKATAEAILAIPADSENPNDGALVDATGTRRRAQALAAIGWSISEQARRVGRGGYKYLLTSDSVTIGTARRVRELFDQLSATPAPENPTTKRSRTMARRSNWYPPAAWDEETIDDPAAAPNLGGGGDELIDDVAVERVHLERLSFGALNQAERIELFRRYGHSDGLTQLCRQWGISWGTMRRLRVDAAQVSGVDEAAA